MIGNAFNERWRKEKSRAFDLYENSTGRGTMTLPFDGESRQVYKNANLSIYSAQKCNARCPFCVEELRPVSRGHRLVDQKRILESDEAYFEALERTLDVVGPLSPSISITGGEPSLDPRLPSILTILHDRRARKLTLTTNGSGLMQVCDGRRTIDRLTEAGVRHLNISRAHFDCEQNTRLMGFQEAPSRHHLKEIVRAAEGGPRVRLSCLLMHSGVRTLKEMISYLDFARALGVDNVIFRQLMLVDLATAADDPVARFSDENRVSLEGLLDQISDHPDFAFQKQILGYYYYVEVWHYQGMDVVLEEADLGQLEHVKANNPSVVHELVFHPNGKLASTWQPWDGILSLETPLMHSI